MADFISEKRSYTIADLTFKKLGLIELKTLISWAALEGWNPGLSDAELFYATDEDGFIGCFIDEELIGAGSIVSYEGDFGFIGLFIVRPEFRGGGIGTHLWRFLTNTLLSRLKDGAAIGMDGVVAMQPFYNRSGFEISYRDERYERTGESFESDPNVSDFKSQDLAAMLDFDLQCFGVNRKKFLIPWLEQPSGKAIKYQINNELMGFAVMRKCHSGFKIGPLFADDFAVAEALYKQCLTIGTGEPVFLDIPVVNDNAMKLVKKYQARYVFECARMYLGTPPASNLPKVFGITSFELG